MFNFLPLINNAVAAEINFLLLKMATIIPSKTINILRFLPILYSLTLYKHLAYHLNTQ